MFVHTKSIEKNQLQLFCHIVTVLIYVLSLKCSKIEREKMTTADAPLCGEKKYSPIFDIAKPVETANKTGLWNEHLKFQSHITLWLKCELIENICNKTQNARLKKKKLIRIIFCIHIECRSTLYVKYVILYHYHTTVTIIFISKKFFW